MTTRRVVVFSLVAHTKAAGPGGHRTVDSQLVRCGGTVAAAGPLSAACGAVAQDAVGLCPYFLQADSQAFQDAGGHAFAFSEEPN